VFLLAWCNLVHCAAFCKTVLSLRMSVTSWSTAKTARDWPMVAMGIYRKSPLGYSGDPSLIPYDQASPILTARNPQSELASQIAAKGCQPARYNNNSGLYWQPMATYHHPTRQYYRWTLGTFLPQKGACSQKLNWKLLKNRNINLTALCTRHVGTRTSSDTANVHPP